MLEDGGKTSFGRQNRWTSPGLLRTPLGWVLFLGSLERSPPRLLGARAPGAPEHPAPGPSEGRRRPCPSARARVVRVQRFCWRLKVKVPVHRATQGLIPVLLLLVRGPTVTCLVQQRQFCTACNMPHAQHARCLCRSVAIPWLHSFAAAVSAASVAPPPSAPSQPLRVPRAAAPQAKRELQPPRPRRGAGGAQPPRAAARPSMRKTSLGGSSMV